ncbi:KPN_02809 family neutral zinc metallopeptidase [Rhodobacter sp. NSM]|uniref:KPN_02809 family neutral zinc metallopeptidase n=1 Tax=Rhodobacter sp. NSM TaxID=3457501 RepID=UPI003FCEF84F
MDWRGRRGSRNIEDRRGARIGSIGGLGGAGFLAVLLIGWVLGVDVTPLLEDAAAPQASQDLSAEDEAAAEFVSVTLADTEEVWTQVFAEQLDAAYRPPVLVLFSQATNSPCGGASGATGPFYCPLDRKAYLDTAFFATMERQLGASGDFAAAYVVAHEIGHHVQNEMGILEEANAIRARVPEAESNAISVRIELQADCFSGIWARHAEQQFGSLEPGDVEEAMNAARQIGDDTLQRNAGRRPMPHTFTHGTSEQRMRWFERGYASGEMAECDSFGAQQL